MIQLETPDSNPELGNRLFTVAIIADTHLNQSEVVTSSPFEVNRLANGRMRHVVDRINALAPAFMINLGDLIHPVPAVPSYAQAAREYLQQTAKLLCPQYLVPGNHDVGDKPIKWGPAGVVCDDYLALWREYFGEQYYSFDYGPCHFVVINAQTINSGLVTEQRQKQWLEQDLKRNRDQRLFLCTHYPPYLAQRDEMEHYDNIGEPGRSWLLGLLEDFSVEALFAGHVHNFWYNRYHGTDCYLLPSTAFVRQDYSEMYRIEAGPEGGRNDAPKLGYCVMHVHEHSHVCHMVRTYGALTEPDAPPSVEHNQLRPIHSVENTRAHLGVDLRQSWTELVEIPPSGALDEFERKLVRNDYPLLGLWEMGIRKLRLPLQDLANTQVRTRMRDLKRFNHEFTVFSFEVPTGELLTALIENQDLVDNFEIGFAWNDLGELAASLTVFRQQVSRPILVSKLRTKEDLEQRGEKYYHVINHGFVADEKALVTDLYKNSQLAGLVDGVVFRLARETSPWQEILAIGAITEALKTQASVHIRMAGSNPAQQWTDDTDNANRVAEALAAVITQPRVSAFVDTFADVERGFFRRNGLTDRRYNPRLGSHVVRNLYAALNRTGGPVERGEVCDIPNARCFLLLAKSLVHMLIVPQQVTTIANTTVPIQDCAAVELIDLETGSINPIAWEQTENGIELVDEQQLDAPALISFALA